MPSDFYAGDRQLPAATCLIDVSPDTHSVTFRNNDTGRTCRPLPSLLPAIAESPQKQRRMK